MNRNKEDLPRTIRRITTTLMSQLNTPRSLMIDILIRAKEWDQIATITTDPRNYLDTVTGCKKFSDDYQASEFLRKYERLPTSFHRKVRAHGNFHDCEQLCAKTNYFLDMLELEANSVDPSTFVSRTWQLLLSMRKTVSQILGPLPDSLSGRFGPGTSFELKGSTFSTLADKVSVTPAVTPNAYSVWRHTVEGDIVDRTRLGAGLPSHQIVRGNRFTTVAKDAKTDRGICIEPLGNLYCQLGVGSYLKKRLKLFGIHVDRSDTPAGPVDLLSYTAPSQGQEIHRDLARQASIDGRFCTIDLSNASDTVCTSLVRILLPDDWWVLLSSLRSPNTLSLKRWVKLEKFSSMGNGFTFELETLIFLACAKAVNPSCRIGVDLFCYGDDIIAPSSTSKDLLALLSVLGFIPNQRKTFTDGPFRESCGGDYFLGYNVRPLYLKKDPENPIDWISLHNRLTRFGRKDLLMMCEGEIPKGFRCYGPPRVGDVVLHRRTWESVTLKKSCPQIKWCRTVVPHPRVLPLDRWGPETTLPLALLGVPSSGISPRGELSGFRNSYVSVS